MQEVLCILTVNKRIIQERTVAKTAEFALLGRMKAKMYTKRTKMKVNIPDYSYIKQG